MNARAYAGPLASRRGLVLGLAALVCAAGYGAIAVIYLAIVPPDPSEPSGLAFAAAGVGAIAFAVLALCLAAVSFSTARSAARAVRATGIAALLTILVLVTLVATVAVILVGGDSSSAGLEFLAVLQGLVLFALALGIRAHVRIARR